MEKESEVPGEKRNSPLGVGDIPKDGSIILPGRNKKPKK